MRKMNKHEICASCPYINDGYYDAERNIYVDLDRKSTRLNSSH